MASGIWRRPALIGAALCTGWLVVGCAQIPTSGPVETGDQVQDAVDAPPIRVLARAPEPGQSPVDVVRGFLAASASFENNHEIARQFLAPRAAGQWNPDAGVTVLDDNPGYNVRRVAGGVQLNAHQNASIGPDGAYVPRGGVPIERDFVVRRVDGEWRIAQLPQGLLLDRIEVSLTFRAFDIYFINPAHTYLVADPVYLPLDQPGGATSLVQALLDGPTRWLRPAVESMIPAGTSLVVESVPVENGVAQVDLSADFLDADPENLELAAAQITSTLVELSSSVTAVSISVEGNPLQLPNSPSQMTGETWEQYDPDSLSPALGAIYERRGSVRHLTSEGSAPVEGPLGSGALDVREPSQSWDGGTVAALDRSRQQLLVTHPFLSPDLVTQREGQRLLPASIDADGRLWSLDVGGAQPRLRVLVGERWHGATLSTGFARSAGPTRSRDISVFRVSADGTRVAMVVHDSARRNAPGQLLLGRVVATGDRLRVEGFRRVELSLTRVYDASWADASTLVVLGATAGSVPEPKLIDLNRTVVSAGPPPADTDAVVGAPGQSLLAGTRGAGVWESAGAEWRRVVAGRDPAYPG